MYFVTVVYIDRLAHSILPVYVTRRMLMFKMLNPRRFYHAVGRRKFLEFILLAVFILFFYGPLLNLLMLAFANEDRRKTG